MTAFMGVGGLNAVFTVMNIPDEDRGGLYRSTNDWSPRMRGTTNRHYRFFELWKSSSLSEDNALISNHGWMAHGESEVFAHGDGGVRGTYFIKGQVVDSNATPQTGVLVSAFRSSDNLYVAQSYSDSNGYYSVPTPYSGSSHFVVAYLDIATDLVGTTVNNLTPSATPWP